MTRTYQCIKRISLTPENEHKIRTMCSTHTREEVAKSIGCHIRTLQSWAKRLGVSFTKTGINNHSAKVPFSEVEMARDLHEIYGLKQREIAEKLEVSQAFVCRVVNYKDRLTC